MKGTKKVLSILLAVFLVFQLCLPVMAKAEEAETFDPPQRIINKKGESAHIFKYEDGMNYYDLGVETKEVDSAQKMYQDYLTSQATFNGYNLDGNFRSEVIEQWSGLALTLMRNNDIISPVTPDQSSTPATVGNGWGNNLADAEKTNIEKFNSWSGYKFTAQALGNENSGGPTFANLLMVDTKKNLKDSADQDDVQQNVEGQDQAAGADLSQDSQQQDADRQAKDTSAVTAATAEDNNQDKADVTAPKVDSKDDNKANITPDKQNETANEDNKTKRGLGVYIYNIKVTPVINDEYIDWAKKNQKMSTDNSAKATESTGVSMSNNTPNKMSGTQATSVNISESVSKTKNGSQTFSFTEGYKVGCKASIAKIVDMSAEISLSATQAFSSGWSDTRSTTVSKNDSISQNVDVPGYSAVKTRQTFHNGNFGIAMDVPMTLTYDVKIVDYGMIDNQNGKVIATYEANKGRSSISGQNDLYQRVYNGKENQGLRYLTAADGTNKAGFNPQNTVDCIARYAPYFTMKDTEFKGKVDDKSLQTDNFISLHPLKKVDTVQDKRDTTIKPGATLYLRDIALAGYLDPQYSDGQGGTAKYATFNRDRGQWVIESGNGIVELSTDSQKQQLLKGLKEGEATIKYVIDEKAYNSAEDMDHFTKNSDLTSTAVFKVKVDKNAKASLMADDFTVNVASRGQKDELNWQKDGAHDGAILGSTKDKGQALYALEIASDNLTVQLDTISTEGETTSTEAGNDVKAESKAPIEAFRIKQTEVTEGAGELTYRAYVEGKGWTDWAKEGEYTGSHGFKAPITAVQVQMVGVAERLDKSSDAMDTAYLVAGGYGLVTYSAGGDSVSDGKTLGDPNGDGCLQELNVSADPGRSGMDISVSDTTKTDDGDLDSITLTDKSQGAKGKLYYRVFTDETGWMDWAESGKPAGSKNLDQGIKAIQIVYSEDGERPNSTDYPVEYTASYENPMNFVGRLIHTVRMNRAAAAQEQQG